MTSVTISLSERYKAAFGAQASANKPNAVTVTQQEKSYDLNFYEKSKDDFEEIEFDFDNKRIAFGTVPFISGETSVNENIIAPPPIISFSQQKKHIITEINGTDSEVIERWRTRPFDIRLRGLLIDIDNRQYPESKVRELYSLFRYNGVVDVTGTQFFDKSISSIYFNNIEINGVQGFTDTLQFTLTARSIKPVGFTLLNPNI